MAVAHSSASESHTGTTGSTNQTAFSWTHTQTGTPRGVLVFVHVANSTLNPVGTVTYGSVTLTQVEGGAAIDSAGEAGRTDLFFAGSGLPSGNQTITVNRTSNAAIMYASAATVTAATNTNVTGIVLLEGDGTMAEQSVDDGTPGTNSLRYAAAYSGLNAPPTTGANSTSLTSIDFGNYTAAMVRETTAGRGARLVGFTTASDDRAAVHVAVRELWNRTDTETVGAFTLTGNAATLARAYALTAEAGTFTATGNDAGLKKPAAIKADVGKFFATPSFNDLAYSEQLTGPYWTKLGVTATENATTAPDGTLTAELFVENTTSNLHGFRRTRTYEAGVEYTASIYLKPYNTSRGIELTLGDNGIAFGSGSDPPTIRVNLNTGTILAVTGSPSATSLTNEGNGWYRASITKTAISDSSICNYTVYPVNINTVYVGDGTTGFYAWGAQHQEGPLTPYEPTAPSTGIGSVATRLASLYHNHTLTGEVGGFALTGQPVALTKNRPVTGGTGAFTLTGQPAEASHNVVIEGGTGAFSLVGNDATLSKAAASKVLTADTGSFALAGGAPGLSVGHHLDPVVGAFAFTGNQAGLADTDRLTAETGAFALTGNPATVRRGYALAAAAGIFTAAGQPATLRQNPRIEANSGSFALSGGAPALLRGRYLSGGAGEFIETGQPVAFRRTWAVQAATGAFAFTGNPASLTELGAYEIDALVGAFTFSGQPANLAQSQTMPVTAGTFTLSGQPATLRQNPALAAETGAFAVSGQPAGLTQGYQLNCAAGSFSVAGNAATLTKLSAKQLLADVGAFALTGQPAVQTHARQLGAAAGAFGLASNGAAFRRTWAVAPDSGTFALTGSAATLSALRAFQLTATAGVFTVGGNAATLRTSRLLSATFGSFALTGNNANLSDTDELFAAAGTFVVTSYAAALNKTTTARRRNVLIF